MSASSRRILGDQISFWFLSLQMASCNFGDEHLLLSNKELYRSTRSAQLVTDQEEFVQSCFYISRLFLSIAEQIYVSLFYHIWPVSSELAVLSSAPDTFRLPLILAHQCKLYLSCGNEIHN